MAVLDLQFKSSLWATVVVVVLLVVVLVPEHLVVLLEEAKVSYESIQQFCIPSFSCSPA